jgi:hypothetical protein
VTADFDEVSQSLRSFEMTALLGEMGERKAAQSAAFLSPPIISATFHFDVKT